MSLKKDGCISIPLDFAKKGAPQYLARTVESNIHAGCHNFKLGALSKAAFPNICAPIAGIVDYYRTSMGCTFLSSNSLNSHPYLSHVQILNPHTDPRGTSAFLDKVWRFDAETHHAVVAGIVKSLRETDAMGKDALMAFELCLDEVTDNILQHAEPLGSSNLPHGFVMAQYHRNNKRIAVAVYDNGQGIRRSLLSGGTRIAGGHDAITAALQKGVTDGNGAGNGLWVMERLVAHSAGSFEITSDGLFELTIRNRPQGTSETHVTHEHTGWACAANEQRVIS